MDYEGRLFIDGEFGEAESGRRFEVINPADESVVGMAADAAAGDVARAVGAARRAADQGSWGTDHAFRQRCLRQLQDGLRKESDTARALQTGEAGICVSNLATHVDAMIEDMSWFIELIGRFGWETDFPPHELMGLRSLRRVRYEPYGVVGAITPWNAPLMTDIWKTTHALATGNTVVLKTAPDTPLTGAFIGRVVQQQTDIPAGVFNVISSADKAAAGEALTSDPRVDMYHFTGSPGVGQRIAERAAPGIRVYDEVLERLTAIVSALPWGDPADPVNVVGPVIRREQLERMAGLVDRARQGGARILAGGRRGDRGGRGFWYLPTVVADVDENAEIAQTEVFGPVLTVVKFDGGEDEAVRVANNSRYGLSAYVQTADPERAWRIAGRLKAGTVNIGPSFYLSPDTPFGGYGISGVGREHGEDGFREYLQAKTIASPAGDAARGGHRSTPTAGALVPPANRA